jgi:hypothetical protein
MGKVAIVLTGIITGGAGSLPGWLSSLSFRTVANTGIFCLVPRLTTLTGQRRNMPKLLIMFLLIMPIIIFTAGSGAAIAQTLAAGVSGNWQLSWVGTDKETHQAVAEFHQSGADISGTLTFNGHVLPLTGTIQNPQINFVAKNFFRRVAFIGTVNGTNMTGKTDANVSWSAKKL